MKIDEIVKEWCKECPFYPIDDKCSLKELLECLSTSVTESLILKKDKEQTEEMNIEKEELGEKEELEELKEFIKKHKRTAKK
jgi:hypothetical protein